MKITLIGNKENIYIDPMTNNAVVNYKTATNFSDVNMFGVNHLVISREDDGKMKVVQAGGYNRMRGLFTDLY